MIRSILFDVSSPSLPRNLIHTRLNGLVAFLLLVFCFFFQFYFPCVFFFPSYFLVYCLLYFFFCFFLFFVFFSLPVWDCQIFFSPFLFLSCSCLCYCCRLHLYSFSRCVSPIPLLLSRRLLFDLGFEISDSYTSQRRVGACGCVYFGNISSWALVPNLLK